MSTSGRSYKFGIALAFLCIISLGLLFGAVQVFLNREGGPLAAIR